MYYPNEVVDEVRMGNEIVSLVSGYVRLKQSGTNHFGLCPFHSEKSPSFCVNADKQMYYCFGCGAGGNAITFIMQVERLGFVDSLKFLADRIHYTLPESYESTAAIRKCEQLYEMQKKAARFYYGALNSNEGKSACAYLDTRKILPKARVRFGLGFAPGRKALTSYLKSQGYDDESLEKSGLCIRDKYGGFYDRFSRRLMFPIMDTQKRVVGFGGRILEQGEPKYLNTSDTPIFDKSRNLYGIHMAKQSRASDLILVEGYMDVISLHQAGFDNSVAALGTAFNQNHAQGIKRFKDRVTVLFDSDDAGTKAALRAIPFLKSVGLQINVLQVTDAKDPDEYIKSFGMTNFQQLLSTSVDDTTFRLTQLRKAYNLDIIGERVRFTTAAAKILAAIESAIERDAHTRQLAGITNIGYESIEAEINKAIRNASRAGVNRNADFHTSVREQKNEGNDSEAQINKGVADARDTVAYYAATNKFVRNAIRKSLIPEEMMDEVHVKLLRAVYDEDPAAASPASLVNIFEELENQRLVSRIFNNVPAFENGITLAKAITDMLKVIKNAYLDHKILNADNNELNELVILKRNVNNLYITL
jgi:DNA primase